MCAVHIPGYIVIAGSTRPNRRSPAIAQWVAYLGGQVGGAAFRVVDLRDLALQLDDEPGIPAMHDYACETTRAWGELVSRATGVVIVTPQYNWGYPAALKNAIDHLYTIDAEGVLTLSLEIVDLGEPADDEILVRVEATPLSPSDLVLLLAPADIATLEASGSAGAPVLKFRIPPARMASVKGRLGRSMAIGNEGAGTVVAAGKNVRVMEGAVVGTMAGGLYADYRKIRAEDAVRLPAGARAADGAAMFMNPLTALAFLETAQREGHAAVVHTAAASSLGQILQKLCLAEGVALINIVRSQEQINILHHIGAPLVLNSKDEDFAAHLADLIAETGATVAFDAIGGGTLGGEILQAMERAYARQMPDFSRYGSDVFKQLYIYGGLDPSPTILSRPSFGFAWSAAGWLLFPYLRRSSPELLKGFIDRIVGELNSTFSSSYSRTVGLADVLQPDALLASTRKATGEKILINPMLG